MLIHILLAYGVERVKEQYEDGYMGIKMAEMVAVLHALHMNITSEPDYTAGQ